MHTRHCLKLADRIDALLQHEIGQGIDRQRLLADALYTRDVLLVCDALVATAGPLLARSFRRAAAAPEEGAAASSAARKPRTPRWAAWLGLEPALTPTLHQAFSSRSNSAPSAT
jgi:hypothetical protein